MNLVDIEPWSRASLLDWIAAHEIASSYNWAFYDCIRDGRLRFSMPGFPHLDEAVEGLRGSADWFGLNYYTRVEIRFSPFAANWFGRLNGPGPQSDMGWEIHPEGLLLLLREASERYHLPIYVTENGIADTAGDRRAAFIQAHMAAITRALSEGIDVRGYFHWSLLDNFEWAEGYRPEFGLYHVDRATMRRTVAPGADTFRYWARR
jgi:beta-glucosidase